jgi:hypothetical protein
MQGLCGISQIASNPGFTLTIQTRQKKAIDQVNQITIIKPVLRNVSIAILCIK